MLAADQPGCWSESVGHARLLLLVPNRVSGN